MAMAEHAHAAAAGFLNFSITKRKRSDPLVFITENRITYDSNTLVNIRRGSAMIGLRRRKRGKQAGIRLKLWRLGPKAVPLPSLLLANVWSQDNKIDEIRLRVTQQTETRNCGTLIFTETWLNNNVPDEALALDGRSLFRAARIKDSGKTRGGGLCVYDNQQQHHCPVTSTS